MTEKVLRSTPKSLDEVVIIQVGEWDNEFKFNHNELEGKRGVLINVRHNNGTTTNHYRNVDEFLSYGNRTEVIYTETNVKELLTS